MMSNQKIEEIAEEVSLYTNKRPFYSWVTDYIPLVGLFARQDRKANRLNELLEERTDLDSLDKSLIRQKANPDEVEFMTYHLVSTSVIGAVGLLYTFTDIGR